MRDAAAPSAGGELTATSMFGLSSYSSPELVRKAKHVDVRTDVWSLGAILYQLLTGRSPLEWSRDSRARMDAGRFLNIPPMKPDEVAAPQSVFRVIETMMKLNPNERYQTMEEMILDIDRALESLASRGWRRWIP